jgi:site-specific DNA recombinase
MLLRNQLYAGIVDVPEYGVRAKRGDFEPLISEQLFYRVQAILSGRVPSTAPRKRAHPDFPLRGFVRCESCRRGLMGSWSKGRNEYYAYYHCRPGCRAVNVSKARLEGLFADELGPAAADSRLHAPTQGVRAAHLESTKGSQELDRSERAAKAIQEKRDRLDEAFLFERSIDIETYGPARREAARGAHLAPIDRHSDRLE